MRRAMSSQPYSPSAAARDAAAIRSSRAGSSSIEVNAPARALYDRAGSAFAELERISIELYRTAAAYAAGKGIIIADTKFELGLDEQGNIVLGDEAFTPDSSRFWPTDEYELGGQQPSYDKQFVRDYAESLGWDKTPPGPELPDEVVAGTRARYLEAFEQITGIPFDDYAASPQTVLR